MGRPSGTWCRFRLGALIHLAFRALRTEKPRIVAAYVCFRVPAPRSPVTAALRPQDGCSSRRSSCAMRPRSTRMSGHSPPQHIHGFDIEDVEASSDANNECQSRRRDHQQNAQTQARMSWQLQDPARVDPRKTQARAVASSAELPPRTRNSHIRLRSRVPWEAPMVRNKARSF